MFQAPLIEMVPTSEDALIECAAEPLSGTLTLADPSSVCVWTRYDVVPGRVSVIGPTLVLAVSVCGAAVNVATTPPALDVNEAVGGLRSTPVISPASARAVTAPETEVSVTAPAAVETDTATPRGICTS
jgi:hypothetical protein